LPLPDSRASQPRPPPRKATPHEKNGVPPNPWPSQAKLRNCVDKPGTVEATANLARKISIGRFGEIFRDRPARGGRKRDTSPDRQGERDKRRFFARWFS